MGGALESSNAARKQYSFGFLRLFFASLVIVGHTPELVDGNRGREILTRMFGSISVGEIAVDAFFIISGFLISLSYMQSQSPTDYLRKRIARIYPGFAVAHLVCAVVIAPLVGGAMIGSWYKWTARELMSIGMLHWPTSPGAFAGTPHPFLNGSMWTVRWEFLCYLLVLTFGTLGLLSKRVGLGVASLTVLIVAAIMPADLIARMGEYHEALRLLGCFLAGAAFCGFYNARTFRPMSIVVASSGLMLALLNARTAHLGVAYFGGYLIFAAAHRIHGTTLGRVNEGGIDVSYGVYLYAWPIEKLLIRFGGGSSLFLLAAATWVLALVCGAISWTLIERPAIRLAKTPRLIEIKAVN